MPAQVSALREEVRNEHRAWPFQLDCRRDIAAIELSGVVYRVRPMRWREKCNLARYSRVGEGFLQRQLIKVCLAEDLPLPEAEDEFDALLALTRWINVPGEPQTEMPLNATVLADAEMTVARQLGVRPSQLAHEKAEFVEQLWTLSRAPAGEAPASAQRARLETSATPPRRSAAAHIDSADTAQERFAQGLPDPGDMSRIRILPDPASGVTGTTADVSAETDEGFAGKERAVKVSTPAAESSPVSAQRQGSERSPQNDASPRVGRQTARFRVRLADERNPAAPSAIPQSLPLLPRVGSALQESSRLQESAPRASRFSESVATAATGTHPTSGMAGLSEPAAAIPKRDSIWPQQVTASGFETGIRDVTAEPGIADRDELFEEFADRLEQAAEQMGIDL